MGEWFAFVKITTTHRKVGEDTYTFVLNITNRFLLYYVVYNRILKEINMLYIVLVRK